MQVEVTRYEQIGRVLDFGSQNAVIIVFVCMCLVGLTAAFFLYATAPLPSEAPRSATIRARVVPLVVIAMVAAVYTGFFVTRLYRASVFPQPHPTSQTILAQSARTAALTAVLAAYPGSASFAPGSDLATDAAELRWSTPRTHIVSLRLKTAGQSSTCTGTVRIGPEVPADAVTGQRDQLNPHTGEPRNSYAPVQVSLRCT